MVRKCVVKVVLSKQQKLILTTLSTRLGISESETLRTSLMDYAKELNLIADTLRWEAKTSEKDAQGQ